MALSLSLIPCTSKTSRCIGQRTKPIVYRRLLIPPNHGVYQKVTSDPIQASAAGHDWAILLTKGGVAYTIGKHGYGQLCDGTTQASMGSDFFKVASGVVAVSAGWTHSLFLKKDGNVYGCGKNDLGKLGAAKSSLAEMGSTGMLTSPSKILQTPPIKVEDLVATPSREPSPAPTPSAKSATPRILAASHLLASFIVVPVLVV